MTENGKPETGSAKPSGKLPPETLAMRSPPARVGRISRLTLIGCYSIGLIGLAGVNGSLNLPRVCRWWQLEPDPPIATAAVPERRNSSG